MSELREVFEVRREDIEKGLSGNSLVVYCLVRENGEVSLPLSSLSRYLGISLNTLRRTLQELVDNDLLIRVGGNNNTPATYTVKSERRPPYRNEVVTPTHTEVEEEDPFTRKRSGGGVNPTRELFKRRNGRQME